MSKLVLLVLSLTMVTGAMAQEPTSEEPGYFEKAKQQAELALEQAELIQQKADRLAQKIADNLAKNMQRSDASANVGIATIEGVVVGQKVIRMARASGKKSGFASGQAAAQAELRAVIAEAHAASAGGRAEAAIKEAIEKTFAGNSAAEVIRKAGGAPLVKVEFVNAGEITKEVTTTVNSTTGGIFGFGKKTVEAEGKEIVNALFEVRPGTVRIETIQTTMTDVVQAVEEIPHGYTVSVVRPAQWGLMGEKVGYLKVGGGVEGFLTQVSDGVAAAINSKATPEIKEAFGGAVPTGAEVRGAILSAGETHTITVQALEAEVKTVARLRDTGQVVEEIAEKTAAPTTVMMVAKKGAPGVISSGMNFLGAVLRKAPATLYLYSAGDFCYRVGDAVLTGDSPGYTFVDDAVVNCVDAVKYLRNSQQ